MVMSFSAEGVMSVIHKYMCTQILPFSYSLYYCKLVLRYKSAGFMLNFQLCITSCVLSGLF